MTKTGCKHLFSLMVVALAGGLAFGCGGASTTPGTGGSGSSGAAAGNGGNGGKSGSSGSSAGAGSGGSGSTAGGSGSTVAGTSGGGSGSGSTAGSGGAAGGTDAGPGKVCATTDVKTGDCKATAEGVYALKTELDVWWQDTINALPLMDTGRGKLNVYFRGTIKDICADGSGGVATMHPCGTELPWFLIDANCKAVHIEFPNDLWDKPGIPDYVTTAHTTGFSIADTLTVDSTTGFLGLEALATGAIFPVAAPADGSTPPANSTVNFTCPSGKKGKDCFLDQDADGKPGITVHLPNTGSFAGTDNFPGTTTKAYYACGLPLPWSVTSAPLGVGPGALGLPGAEYCYIGLKTSLGGSGNLATCTSGAGAATSGDTLPSRVYDCKKSDGTACTAADAGFVDTNTPTFHVLQAGQVPPTSWKQARETASLSLLDRTPSKGPRASVVRLGDLGSTHACADIRGAAFPAFQ